MGPPSSHSSSASPVPGWSQNNKRYLSVQEGLLGAVCARPLEGGFQAGSHTMYIAKPLRYSRYIYNIQVFT